MQDISNDDEIIRCDRTCGIHRVFPHPIELGPALTKPFADLIDGDLKVSDWKAIQMLINSIFSIHAR